MEYSPIIFLEINVFIYFNKISIYHGALSKALQLLLLAVGAQLECFCRQIVAVSFEAFARDPGVRNILVEGIVVCWYFHQAGLWLIIEEY